MGVFNRGMTAQEKRWSDLGYDVLTREYLEAGADIARAPQEGSEATRRYYRRFELVQERVTGHESKQNGDTLACRKGCSYCCHHRVSAPAQEVLTLVERIEGLPAPQRAAVVEKVSRNAERVESMDGQTAFRTPMPCALLGENNACSVYDDRPSKCRQYHSLSLEACETSFFRPDDLSSRVPLSTPLLVASTAHYLGFRKVLEERGVDTMHYELHTALREALSDPQACGERLARGEPAFVHATKYGDQLRKP